MAKQSEVQRTEQETVESDPWQHVHIRVIEPVGWSCSAVDAGLRSLERLRSELKAATALLVAARPNDRDATASLSRLSGVSNREARQRRAVAAVVATMPSALGLLQSGAVTVEHLSALRAVVEKPGVEELLASAVGMSPEEFSRAVHQFRLSFEHGDDVAGRHHAARSLRFSDGPDGMVRLSGLLPPVQGRTLETMLGAIREAAYRRDHPERAKVLGGHDTDTRDQRLADALFELAGITPTHAATRGGTAMGSSSGSTADDDLPAMPADVRPVNADVGRSAKNWSTDRPPIRVTTSKPATVIVSNVERIHAEMLNHGPVPVTASMFDDVRRELYFCFENDAGEVLKYVRGRREPSLLQKIAVWARDRRCRYPGCDSVASMGQVHHINEWLADQGFTDVDVPVLLCHAHHQHLHVNQLIAVREADGSVAVRVRATGEAIATATPKRLAA